jgi:sugar phosphate isomerase/epimerase
MVHLATVAPFGFCDFHPPTILGLYRRLGCTRCQFYRNTNSPPEDAEVVDTCAEAGLVIDSIHGVFGEEHDPSSTDERLRAKSIVTYRAEGELALRLGGPQVVVHPSPLVPRGHLSRVTPAVRAARMGPLRKSMEQLARIGEEMGVVYLFENLPDVCWIGDQPLMVAEMVREIGSPRLRMCFDSGHALITGKQIESLRGCADVVDYVHIHDNDGIEDLHLMPGDGVTPWTQFGHALLETLPNVSAMLEVFYPKEKLEKCLEAGLAERFEHWLKATV